MSAVLTCTPRNSREQEPNNSPSSANPAEMDKNIEGFFNSSDDVDFFRLNVDSDKIFDIRLSGLKGINVAFKIWKGSGDPELVKIADDNRKSAGERIINFFAKPDVYYVSVCHGERDRKNANIDVPYRLLISTRDPLNNEEIEPNDTPQNAQEITPGNDVSGYYSQSYNRMNNDKTNQYREDDWFVFSVKDASDDKPIIMDATVTTVQGVNAVIAFYDDDKKELLAADAGGMGDGESISGYGIKNNGKYYLMVSSRGYSSNFDESYTVGLVLKEYNTSLEMENNNTFEDASRIVNNAITGGVNTPGDVDFFKYTSKATLAFYRIEVQPPEDLDPIVYMYTNDQKKIIQLDSYGRGVKQIYPNIKIEGDFYISIGSKHPAAAGGGEYELTVTPIEFLDRYEIEPNDTREEANKIKGNTIVGFISRKSDKDYFSIETDGRTSIVLTISGVSGGALSVSVADQLGFLLKSVTVKAKNSITLTEMIDKKGYIIVESIKDSYVNPYTITIRGL